VHETKAYSSIPAVIKLAEVVSCNAALWKTRQTRLTHIDKPFIHGQKETHTRVPLSHKFTPAHKSLISHGLSSY